MNLGSNLIYPVVFHEAEVHPQRLLRSRRRPLYSDPLLHGDGDLLRVTPGGSDDPFGCPRALIGRAT